MFEQTLSSEGSDCPSGRKSRFFSAALALYALGLLAVLGASLWAVEDPEAARKARLQGDVVLEAIITARGEIEEVHVVKSAGAILDASAEGAVRRWRYRPAILNRQAVRVLLTVTITFRLH